MIDLRSDTVTQPTQEMREAIYRAKVGDDIMGDDPTIKRLEQMSAELLGKEAGLFLVSGTMANQVAVMTWAQRGDEVLLSDKSHLFNLENGGLAALCQVQTRTFPMVDEHYPVDIIKSLIRVPGIQQPKTALICLENTCDLNAGLVVPPASTNEVVELSKKHGIPLYLDGARIFNAAVALDQPVQQLVQGIDSAMFALTKGLSAPFGAMLVGDKQWIEQARYNKQRLGGGFRQAGFMAAAGIVALENMIPRIEIDHANARRLAEGISEIPKLKINLTRVHTNILTIALEDEDKTDILVQELFNREILVKRITPVSVRLVTHRLITEEHVVKVISALKEISERYL